MKETDLAQETLKFFNSPAHEIFCEVQCAGIIDIVVRCNKTIIAVECKTTFGLSVIEQAVKNLSYAHYSYVAVPKISSYFAERICRQYGVGVLVVPVGKPDGYMTIEKVAPRLNRRIVTPKLDEYQKLNTPGVQSGRYTSFSWFVEELERQLRRAPNGLTHKELFEQCHRHYQNPAYMKRNLLTYIQSGVIKNVEYKNKMFFYNLSIN